MSATFLGDRHRPLQKSDLEYGACDNLMDDDGLSFSAPTLIARKLHNYPQSIEGPRPDKMGLRQPSSLAGSLLNGGNHRG